MDMNILVLKENHCLLSLSLDIIIGFVNDFYFLFQRVIPNTTGMNKKERENWNEQQQQIHIQGTR